ncbi:hypothetical protein [Helicobacter felis]|uniref:hypothetical protein n=1 Tax=Helicobacter felis TaxID=214 RepID=UPI000CF0E172|nr:hypothetical protein [Helicobacter felis]
MEDLEESLKAIESESLEKGKPQGLLRRFWNLCPLFVGRAFFSYLPLAISYLFKDTAGHDFMASVFLSLSFVFILRRSTIGVIFADKPITAKLKNIGHFFFMDCGCF